MQSFSEYRGKSEDVVEESAASSRYSVEVNYRTTTDEILDSFAKICLGFVSAALKNQGYHTKHVYEEKPIRLLVSSRNWDDGEWVGVVSWHHSRHCFVISKGFYNRDRRTVSVQSSHVCKGTDAGDITKELHNLMHGLKGEKDRHQEKMKPVPLKRGPKS